MTSIVPFRREHMEQVRLIPLLSYSMGAEVDVELLESLPGNFTLLSDEGRALMCSGVVEHWPGRGEAWAAIDSEARKTHPLAIVRAGMHTLKASRLARVEAVVLRDGFPEGHKFVRLLGFELECDRMRSYHPGGRDCSMYVRIAEAAEEG